MEHDQLITLCDLFNIRYDYKDIWGSCPMIGILKPGKRQGQPGAFLHIVYFPSNKKFTVDYDLTVICPEISPYIEYNGCGEYLINL
jgi:hypothetical protein